MVARDHLYGPHTSNLMPVSPTSLVLDLRADYEQDGDTVLVSVYLVDPALEVGFPGLVKAGTCSMYYRGNPIREVAFDKRFGNGAEGLGDFVFQFSHPPAVSDLQVQVDMDLYPYAGSGANNSMSKRVPVTAAEENYAPLKPQITTGKDLNGELRSQKRVEELL